MSVTADVKSSINQFCFSNSYRFLTISNTYELADQAVGSVNHMESWKQTWKVRKFGEDGLYIEFNQNHVLTYDEASGKVYLSEFTGDETQIWYVKKTEKGN